MQYSWPALSNNHAWKTNFCLLFEWPLKTGFTELSLGSTAGRVDSYLIADPEGRLSSIETYIIAIPVSFKL